MKVLFRQYTSYGKYDNETLEHQWVDEDTPEARAEALEDYDWADWNGSKEDFINGKTNEISYWCAGDWDDPTGGCFTVTTKEVALYEIESTYKKSKQEINRLFGEENNG